MTIKLDEEYKKKLEEMYGSFSKSSVIRYLIDNEYNRLKELKENNNDNK